MDQKTRSPRENEAAIKCPLCGSTEFRVGGMFETLVGYGDTLIDGLYHRHDDNCRKAGAWCENGHEFAIRYQNFCNLCDWVGKTKCFCDPENIVVLLKGYGHGTESKRTK